MFEIKYGGLLTGNAKLAVELLERIRTVLKTILSSISAITLFAGNYYGKLSLDETVEDHRRMITLFEMAERQITENGETEELLYKLAREELSENGTWVAYQSVNKPEINL